MSDIDRHTGKPISGVAAVKQAIDSLLRTSKGERIMRADIGVTFQNKDGTAGPNLTASQIEADCQEALAKYEPRIENVAIAPDLDEAGYLRAIEVSYDLKEDRTRHAQTVTYDAWKHG
jgi:phage baseplate assembly protein W